ncbi:hypothetical protein C0J52_17288 [Blattella germanica]|nr:hypothetical protein C0J52_17288 [Blattella germanica]
MAQPAKFAGVPNEIPRHDISTWKHPGTADGEIVCGVGNDCIIFPSQTTNVVVTEVPQSQVQYTFPDQDFLDIQVTEEEVISEVWDNGQPDDESQQYVELKVACNPTTDPEEIEIPLPQDQDAYTTMRPYPCDFCSRRFRKKANLMNHMVIHQKDRPHGCNLCGIRFRRKCDLHNHLKIHAYAPGINGSDDDDEAQANNSHDNDNISSLKGRRKKAQSAAPKKRKSIASTSYGSNYVEDDDDNSFNSKDLKKSNHSNTQSRKKYSSTGSSYSYVDEDMKLLSQPPPTFTPSMEPQEPAVPRWPVVDETRPYVCQHCGVGFAREKALASHARVHAGDSPFECNTCGEMFWDVGLLKEHSRTKHGGRSRDELDSSGPYTGDDRFGEFHCETCGLGFHRQDLLKRHRRVHVKLEPNTNASEHVCQVCGQSFPEQSDLLTHAETHARYQPHRCMLCGECFLDGPAVAAHVRRRHARNIPPNACTLCGKTCKDRRSLQKHAWVHSAERSFSCHKCGKRFHSRARLKRHMVSHRDKAVVLREHIRSHHSGPEPRSSSSHAPVFVCKVCAAAFSSSEQLCAHLIQHSDENTAKQRMPKLGPRKYKRRRKLNPHELTLLSNVASSTHGDMSDYGEPDSDEESISFKRKISKKKYKQRRANNDDNLQSVVKNLETVIDNFNSVVHPKSESGKEKLDRKKHKNKRKPGVDGKLGVNNSKSRTNVSSGGFIKSTRPAGESRIRPRTKNVTVSSLAALKAVTSKTKSNSKANREVSRMGPRTKNVNYHNVKMSKLPTATFPGKSKNADQEIRQENSESNKEENKNESVKSHSDKVIPSSNAVEGRKEVKVEFTCEMCSETFTKRSELLIHVPIHI